MNNPQISVVTANYNHARLLPRCLAALLNQSVAPLEIIVVDDASTDNSMEVLRELALKHPAIRLYSNAVNLGVNQTNNRGLALARGDYVFFAAADDEVRPGLIEQTSKLLRAHPGAGLCSSLCEWRSESAGLTWLAGAAMPARPCFLSPAEMVALGRRGRLTISGPSTVFKKSALVEAGTWIPELKWFTDFFGAHVVGFRYGMCHVPEVLANFNLSPASYYHSVESRTQRREVMDRLLQFLESEKYADVAPLIRDSGILGAFGWPMLRLVAVSQKHRGFLNTAFVLRAGRRCAEVIGRRYFPKWLAKLCLKIFYRA